MLRRIFASAGLVVALGGVACHESIFIGDPPSAPRDLFYELEPSGDPTAPLGIILFWEPVTDPDLSSYRIYSRGSTTGAFGLRGETSSNSFHDNGVPHLEYYVTAVDVDGDESRPSNTVLVDERLQLQRPSSLFSISLNGAIHLSWTDNAYAADPDRFKWYRIYSTTYDLDSGFCGVAWELVGTTVAPEFLASVLANGLPRCFGVSAISIEGHESLWSPLRQDTPRPDGRNVLVWAYDENQAASGFRFWRDADGDGRGDAGELGLVLDGNRTDIDFWVFRDAADSTLWIVPEFAGTRVRLYSTSPLGDLTDIDFAPPTGYTRDMIQAVPTYGYVFEIVEGQTVRYGALRVTHVGRDYLIFDWSFQTDPGNAELELRGSLPTVSMTGSAVGS